MNGCGIALTNVQIHTLTSTFFYPEKKLLHKSAPHSLAPVCFDHHQLENLCFAGNRATAHKADWTRDSSGHQDQRVPFAPELPIVL